jgi:uncharacterized protein (DUF2252 family)
MPESSLINNKDRDVWDLIQSFNQQRDPQLLLKKYAQMRKDAFSFFRGSCHLFYQDLPIESSLNLAPATWICGDLHLENFGTYKGDDRRIYFGINDFDESELAPFTWDIARVLTSIYLAVASWSLVKTDQHKLTRIYLDSYVDNLCSGQIKAINEDNTQGIVADLIKTLNHRKRRDLLDERTELIKNDRHLKIDDRKILKISRQKYQQVSQIMAKWAQSQTNPAFFEVLDIGFRVAGTGSLGLDRYLILIAGKGAPDQNYLLDFKLQLDSSLQPYLQTAQPQWLNSATRVMTAQKLVQVSPPAILAAIEFDQVSYLVRELQPTQDKIDFKPSKIGRLQLEQLIDTLGKVTAFAHLHGSGRLGAASSTELIDFGASLDWQSAVINYASNYAQQVQLDYQSFSKATQDL